MKHSSARPSVTCPTTPLQSLFFDELRGGMPQGSHVTKAKRRQKEDNTSLVSALGSFLKQWEGRNKQYQGQYQAQKPTRHTEYGEGPMCQPPQRKRQRTGQQPQDSVQEGTLVQELLAFLQKCQEQQIDDNTVASRLATKLRSWQEFPTENSDSVWWSSKRASDRTITKDVTKDGHSPPGTPSLPIVSVNASEWPTDTKFTSKGKLLKSWEEGKPQEGNLVVVKSLDEFHEIQDQRTAFGCTSALTVLLNETIPADLGKKVSVTVQRGHQKPKLEELSLISLGLATLCPKPRNPTSTSVRKFQPETKVTVRVCAPAHYREQYLPKGEWDSAHRVLLEIANWRIAPASTCTGGHWQWSKVQKHYQLVGHLRVAPQIAKALELNSGKKGVFITQTGVDKRTERLKWYNKANADHENHLTDCLADAHRRGQGLKFRCGGGNDIGVISLPTDTIEKRSSSLTVQGIPKEWDAPDVAAFLTDQGWSAVQPTSCRPMGRGKVRWYIKAMSPPGGADEALPNCTWHYVDKDDESLQVYVCKASGRFPKPQDIIPVRPPKKSYQLNIETKEIQEIAATVMDDDESAEHDIQTQREEAETRERSRSPVSRRPRPETKTVKSNEPMLTKEPDDIEQALLEGYEEIDQSGTGDCGFRALAASISFSQNGELLTQDQSRTQGAKLRGAAISYLRKHKEDFVEFFATDPDDETHDSLENAKTSFGQWLTQMGLPNTWIDGLVLQALSIKTGIPIIIWRYKNDDNGISHWNRSTLAPAFKNGWAKSARNTTPVVLLLKNKHYTWLKPPKGQGPKENWLKESAIPDYRELQGSAKSSVGARSVKSLNTPSIHTKASEATPSVHTLKKIASVAGYRSHKKQASSGVTPSVHTLNLSAAYAGSCSTKDSRPDFGPSDKEVDTDTSDPLVWTCRLCPGHTKFTAKSRPQLMWTRANHLKKRHPNRTEKMSDPLRKLTPAVIPSEHIPIDTRGWSCPWCPKGLPDLPRYQREKSIKAHIQQEHPKKKLSHTEARWRKFRLDRTLDPIMDKSKSQLGKKLQQFYDNKPCDTNGHDIVKFTPDWKDLPKKNKKQTKKTITEHRKGRAVTCTKCWRFQFRSSLQKGKCLGKVTSTSVTRTIWLRLLKASPTNAQHLLKAWNVTLDEANKVWMPDNDHRSRKRTKAETAQAKCPKRSKTEADHAFGKLVEEGVEPHPGPASMSCISLNVGGAPGTWLAMNDFLQTPGHQVDILLLQETAFKPNEYESFERSLKKIGYKSFYTPGLPTPGRWNSLEPRHGVLTVVRSSISHSYIGSSSEEQAARFQTLVIQIGNWTVVNTYAPPRPITDTLDAAGENLELLKQFNVGSGNRPWIWAGDFNHDLAPDMSEPFSTVADAQGATPLPGLHNLVTRWKGKKNVGPCLYQSAAPVF